MCPTFADGLQVRRDTALPAPSASAQDDQRDDDRHNEHLDDALAFVEGDVSGLSGGDFDEANRRDFDAATASSAPEAVYLGSIAGIVVDSRTASCAEAVTDFGDRNYGLALGLDRIAVDVPHRSRRLDPL